jgi:hypothetical protein
VARVRRSTLEGGRSRSGARRREERRGEDWGGAEHAGGRDGGRGRRGPGQSKEGWRPGKEETGGLVEEDERKKERSKRYVCN